MAVVTFVATVMACFALVEDRADPKSLWCMEHGIVAYDPLMAPYRRRHRP